MRKHRKLIAVLAVAQIAALAASNNPATARDDALPSFRVDTRLRPDPPELDPAHGVQRPLVVVRDEDGVIERFVVDQIILYPSRVRSLAEFQALFGGQVLSEGKVPAPPEGVDPDRIRAVRPPAHLLLRVDTAKMPTQRLHQDAAEVGLKGRFNLSSEEGLRLTALLARATLEGFDLEPVMVGETNLAEHPTASGFLDPTQCTGPASLRFPYLCDGPPPQTGTAKAWDHLELLRPLYSPRSVFVAVIDRGFTVDPSGNRAYGNLDLPSWSPGYNFNAESSDLTAHFFDLPDGSTSPCDTAKVGHDPQQVNREAGACWHGTSMTAVATAIANNRYGVAGVGQPHATPMLFQDDSTTYSWGRALWTALSWGADVVNLSLAHGCGRFSRNCGGRLLRDAAVEAYHQGVSVVASAGNIARSNNNSQVVPCELFHVICVGALADDSPVAATWGEEGSNWGSQVDVWSPTNIRVAPVPRFDGTNWKETPFLGYEQLQPVGGTSGAAAFVSGAVALIRSADPSLGAAGVIDILAQTVDRGSSDPKVLEGWGMLDVFAAVYRAAAGYRERTGQPVPPSDVQASPESGTAIRVTWVNNSDIAASVRVKAEPPARPPLPVRRVTVGANQTTAVIGTQTSADGTVLKLQPNTKYTVTVSACSAAGVCSDSHPVTVQTINTVPAAPIDLQGRNLTSSGVTLAWDYTGSNPVTHFRLVRYLCGPGHPCNPLAPPIRLGALERSFVIGNLVGNWSVHWRIQACNDDGCGAWVDGLRIDTPSPGSAPAAPTNLHLCGQGGVPFEACLVNRVTLIWNDNASNEDRYEFEWAIAQIGTPPWEAAWSTETLGPNARSYWFTSSSLSSGVIYHFRARACNVYGCSGYSNMIAYSAP